MANAATLVEQLVAGDALSDAQLQQAFEAMLRSEWTPVQTAAFLTAVRAAGETEATLRAGVNAMRSAMVTVPHDHDVVFDTCGTGGDGRGTLNVSTIAAIVVAACGVRVAKHGNRSASSRAGSADLIEALGLPLELPLDKHVDLLRSVGITFLYAPAFHPALRTVAQVRRELGFRTVFNALGPLCNPARATHQLIGVYSEQLLELASQALATLGTVRAWVVRSEDGLDEVSPSAPTHVRVVEHGEVQARVITPQTFGLVDTPLEALTGGDAQENAKIALDLLHNRPHAAKTAVVLNAAASLVVATGRSEAECASLAVRALEAGDARELFFRWKSEANP